MQLTAIGRIATPWQRLEDCPRNVTADGPPCRLIVEPDYREGLTGLYTGMEIEILYWLDLAHFDRLQRPSRKTGETKGVFALRTPHRPNPIGSAHLPVIAVEDSIIVVRGLDCLDGTTLLDIKPHRGQRV